MNKKYNTNYKNKSRNFNMTNKIIAILFLILLVIILFLFKSCSDTKLQTTMNETKLINQVAKQEIINWDVKAEELKNECAKVNKLEVLQGNTTIRDTYTKNTDVVQSKTGIVKFLKKKFEELKMEQITVETTFQYTYTYDISDLDIVPTDNGLIVTLRRCNVNLNPIAEIGTNRLIETEEGILGDITAQETSAVMECVNLNTYNKLIKDNKLYKEALDNTKINLEELINKFNGFDNKNIKINIDYGFDFIDGEEVKIIEETNNND